MKPPRLATVTHRQPRRIQRQRSKGWRMPRTAVYVGRGTLWGNGWKIGEPHPETGAPLTRAEVVALYRQNVETAKPETLAKVRDMLGGRDLACWCRLDQACHADVLLEIANAPEPEPEPECLAVLIPEDAARTISRLSRLAKDDVTADHVEEYAAAAAQVIHCEEASGHALPHRAGETEWDDSDVVPDEPNDDDLMQTAMILADEDPEDMP